MPMIDSNNYKLYLQRCLDLSQPNAIYTAPNPSVGAVIVVNDKIIAEGYTQAYGGNHAEVECINNVPTQDKNLLAEATLFVSLEPCNHYGKTPPCTQKIISSGIKHVVIGCIDTHPLVKGKGISTLSDAGVKVDLIELDRIKNPLQAFLTSQNKRRPFITLKWAQSCNKRIANVDKSQVNISDEIVQRFTHLQRAKHQAILVGANTIINDKPKLDIRFAKGINPIIIVADKYGKITDELLNAYPNYLLFSNNPLPKLKNKIIGGDESFFQDIFEHLFVKGINSVYVEGGSIIHNELIRKNFWDEATVYENPSLTIINGYEAPIIRNNFLLETQFNLGNCMVNNYTNTYNSFLKTP